MTPRGQPLLIVLLLLMTALGVARTQPRLARTAHQVKQTDDIWVLPPPPVLRAATLGYTAAATDLLWAKLLVDYGVHWAEHRPFTDLNLYLDAIVGLEPDYAPLYRFVDTMLVYRPLHGTEQDARAARRYLERGTVERPYDHVVWLEYGQFIAFVAPSFLTSEEEKMQWRRDGAIALTRAVELGADADRSLAAAALLSRWGLKDAAIKNLQRAYALTDDENTRAQILEQLGAWQASEERDAAERTVKEVESRWRAELPFVPRGEFLLLDPSPDPVHCAGLARSGKPDCAHDWPGALEEASP